MDASVLRDVYATRYMSAVGLVVLCYDHVLTFSDEVNLIWRAPASFAKYTFLFNRYLVLSTQIVAATEMCGFVGNIFTAASCRQILISCSMIAVVSVGIMNLLVLLRVVLLWDHKPMILRLMVLGFIVSFLSQLITMVVMLIDLSPSVIWVPVAYMCMTMKSSRILIAVWGSPMIFEVLVLVSTSINALDRPRVAQLPITKALRGDGILYFLTITCLRIINLSFSTLNNPSMTMLIIYFTWAMTTTVLNRSLLAFRRAELEGTNNPMLSPIRPSPFALSGHGQPRPQSEAYSPPLSPTFNSWELRPSIKDPAEYHYQKRTSYA